MTKHHAHKDIPIVDAASSFESEQIGFVYASARENLDVSPADCFTARDLAELSGHDGPAVHALLLCMFDQLAQGAVCLRLDRQNMVKKLSRFTSAAEDLAAIIERDIVSWSGLVHCIDGAAGDARPDNFLPLTYVRDTGRLYFQKYHLYEQTVIGELGRLMKKRNAEISGSAGIRRMMKSVLEDDPLYFRGSPAVLNPAQIMAMCLSLTSGLIVISGGPGTGKTSIVLNILRLFSRAGVDPSRMMVAAPTGRAAQRLTESVRRGIAGLSKRSREDIALEKIEAATLHRLLKFSSKKNGFLFNRNNRLGCDLLIIDEVSMVDIVLLGRLLGAIGDDTTVVLLGDKNQLPSVEAGAVLADLMPDESVVRYTNESLALLAGACPASESAFFREAEKDETSLADHFVILDKSYRSEKSILDAAENINMRDMSVLDRIPLYEGRSPLPAQGIHRIDPGAEGRGRRDRFATMLESWAVMNFGAPGKDGSFMALVRKAESFGTADFGGEEFSSIMGALFGLIERSRVLSLTRRGDFGADMVNAHMTRFVTGSGAAHPEAISGLPVIVEKNDYGRELFNGDIGLTIRVADNNVYAFFPGARGFRSFPLQTIPVHGPAWAITVHKSQGSEYDRILLAFDEKAGRLLTREIIYTAVTRARSLAIIFADRSSLQRSVASGAARESGIDLAAIVS